MAPTPLQYLVIQDRNMINIVPRSKPSTKKSVVERRRSISPGAACLFHEREAFCLANQ